MNFPYSTCSSCREYIFLMFLNFWVTTSLLYPNTHTCIKTFKNVFRMVFSKLTSEVCIYQIIFLRFKDVLHKRISVGCIGLLILAICMHSLLHIINNPVH